MISKVTLYIIKMILPGEAPGKRQESEIPDNELDQEVQGEEDEPEGEDLATETQGLFPEVLAAKRFFLEIGRENIRSHGSPGEIEEANRVLGPPVTHQGKWLPIRVEGKRPRAVEDGLAFEALERGARGGFPEGERFLAAPGAGEDRIIVSLPETVDVHSNDSLSPGILARPAIGGR